MLTRLESNNSDKLIIFLTGWGCDDIQFENMLQSNDQYDVLLCWDYSVLTFSPNLDFEKYKEIYLITYSAGVYVAGLIQDNLPKITKSIAINGNPFMFDEYFGIKEEILNVFRSLNMSNYMRFRRDYLVTTEEEYEFFNAHASLRDFDSCNKELDNLEKYSKTDFKPYNYDIAILGDKDKIYEPNAQREYYQGKFVLIENTAHNVFYKFQTFDAILRVLF